MPASGQSQIIKSAFFPSAWMFPGGAFAVLDAVEGGRQIELVVAYPFMKALGYFAANSAIHKQLEGLDVERHNQESRVLRENAYVAVLDVDPLRTMRKS